MTCTIHLRGRKAPHFLPLWKENLNGRALLFDAVAWLSPHDCHSLGVNGSSKLAWLAKRIDHNMRSIRATTATIRNTWLMLASSRRF